MTKFSYNQEQTQAEAVQVEHNADVSLRGAFISVTMLGGFMLLTWLLAFVLFIQ